MRNYHTHTTRCQHATGTDREYVEHAVAEGFKTLGFADHSPWPYADFVSGIRMTAQEFPGYLRSIVSLRDEYKDRIDLKIGLECEYFKPFFPWLDELKGKNGLDYLLLGCHFIGDEEHGLYSGKATHREDLYRYLEEVEDAMQDGRFLYLCHPDLVLSCYPEFDDACADLAHQICQLSKSYHFPLEYNVLGLEKRSKHTFNGLGYPCKQFWDIVGEEVCDVVIGLDAHRPDALDGTTFRRVESDLRQQGFRLVDPLEHD